MSTQILNPFEIFGEVIAVTGITFDIDGNLIADGSGFGNSGDVLKWTIDDGGAITEFIQDLTPAYTLINATASVIISSTDDFAFVTTMVMNAQNIDNELDISVLTELGGIFQVRLNASMTSIIFPVSSNLFTLLRMNGCDLTGILDITNLSNISGTLEAQLNPNLTGLLLPTTTNLLQVRIASCNLTGTLDLSMITGLSGVCSFNSNPNLTEIIFPTSTNVISQLFAFSCNLTGTLDLSGLTGLGGDCSFSSNPNLTEIIFPITNQTFVAITIGSCDLTGTLDMSDIANLATTFQVFSNPNLTQILFPTTSSLVSQMQLQLCNLTGTLDLSGLTGLGGTPHRFYSNPNLTGILLPATTRTFGAIRMESCNLDYVDFTVMINCMAQDLFSLRIQDNSMVVGDVNHLLADLAGLVSGESGGGDFTGRFITIDGTNAAPDGSSGGFDGDQAVLDLQGKGITVTTS